MARTVLLMFVAIALTGTGIILNSGERVIVSTQAGCGTNCVLPAPNPGPIPTVNIAPAVGWPDGATPPAACGITVTDFATGFDHPRWLDTPPDGDLLVAERNAPARLDTGSGMNVCVNRVGRVEPDGMIPWASCASC